MIHASITGNNIRRDEVNRSLDGAMDFAFEKTFKKGQQMFGTEKTIENMKNCLKKYITEEM